MHKTRISKEKIDAYLNTDYRLNHVPAPFSLTVGARSDALLELFSVFNTQCGALITACNPAGTEQSEQANLAAQEQLVKELAQLGFAWIDAAAIAKDASWPAERGCFIFGIELDQAKTIGSRYLQDAIIWAADNGVAQLILLR